MPIYGIGVKDNITMNIQDPPKGAQAIPGYILPVFDGSAWITLEEARSLADTGGRTGYDEIGYRTV